MIPAAVVDQTLNDLVPLMQKGDIIIDGGNSYYIDDIRRAKELAPKRHPLCRLWDERGRLGDGAGILPDDWRARGDR